MSTPASLVPAVPGVKPPPSRARRAGAAVLGGLAVAGRFVGRSVSSAYRAVDPDVRRHIAELPLAGLTLIGARHPDLEALPPDGHRTLIFVHGLGGARNNFLPMRLWFRWRGRSRSYSVDLPPGAPLDALAQFLRERVDAIASVNALGETEQVDLVAHSMGGVVARLALEDPALRARVASLVTLGTPHGGTHAARYASTIHTRELRPDSPTIARLRAQLPWSGPRLVCFWSTADVLLLPATTGRVEGVRDVPFEGITHYGFLLYPRVWQRVAEALA